MRDEWYNLSVYANQYAITSGVFSSFKSWFKLELKIAVVSYYLSLFFAFASYVFFVFTSYVFFVFTSNENHEYTPDLTD